MSRTVEYTIEHIQGGYALTINGRYMGRYGSNAAAMRAKKLHTSGQRLDPRTVMLVNEARAEHARSMRG